MSEQHVQAAANSGIDLAAYVRRIVYGGTREPSLAVLQQEYKR